jgi:hypothetical protein
MNTDWRSRFAVPLRTVPHWARNSPDHLVYAANDAGAWQTYAWNKAAGSRRLVTRQRSGARLARLTPDGDTICWFAHDGTEPGRWLAQPFEGGADRPLLTDSVRGYVAVPRTARPPERPAAVTPEDGAPRPGRLWVPARLRRGQTAGARLARASAVGLVRLHAAQPRRPGHKIKPQLLS